MNRLQTLKTSKSNYQMLAFSVVAMLLALILFSPVIKLLKLDPEDEEKVRNTAQVLAYVLAGVVGVGVAGLIVPGLGATVVGLLAFSVVALGVYGIASNWVSKEKTPEGN